ncbi:MAG: hypothetical protein MAG581_01877 [Deltaproteobacteria bacterium]|jgi:hypothetical protein|nr:hypothetical protein [Deltaproteobacteria bacterium]
MRNTVLMLGVIVLLFTTPVLSQEPTPHYKKAILALTGLT